ncbi:MAG TPA: S41 family peptidase [Flavisolibacter sp.]|nr:S41 family peptidase [Flavisolibacter sp.]
MKKISYTLTILLLAILSLTSCTKALLGEEEPNTPTSNFEVLWQDFDQHYGAFGPKNINWKEQYAKFRPKVNDHMNDQELYTVMKELLDVLDDNHIYLRPTAQTGLPWYNGGILGRTVVEDYKKAVAQSYLTQKTVYDNALEYGLFSGNIGYINIKNMDNNINSYYKAMDVVLDALKDTKGIIIELRENGGGEDRVSQYIANRFASERHLSFSSRLRNGPGYNDFSEPINFYTEPAGDFQYTKPVIVLTNLNSYSAAETFVLAMLQNKNVTTIGDVTGGALSDAVERDLPNGWSYRMPIADVRDATGKNLEGIGIQPHIKVKNTKAELESGHDKALEKALERLQ